MVSRNRTYFVKPSHPGGVPPRLDTLWVNRNRLNGIDTTLLLDTNVLINMERVVLSGNKSPAVKEAGLHHLVHFLLRSPPKSVVISPGLALDEMPPGRAELCQRTFDQFCARHLPGFVDTPDCIRATYDGKTKDYGFFDLEPDGQALLAIPFSALIYLQLLYRRQDLEPIDKFERYLALAEKQMNLLSAKEMEIGRYCFANPPAAKTELGRICDVFRRNFVLRDKKPARTVEQLIRIAFNGACDLTFINMANGMDGHVLSGRRQDCWIATCDGKLAEFAEFAHYVNFDGQAGKYIATTFHPEQRDDIFWFRSATSFQALNLHRRVNQVRGPSDMGALRAMARHAADYAAETFAQSNSV